MIQKILLVADPRNSHQRFLRLRRDLLDLVVYILQVIGKIRSHSVRVCRRFCFPGNSAFRLVSRCGRLRLYCGGRFRSSLCLTGRRQGQCHFFLFGRFFPQHLQHGRHSGRNGQRRARSEDDPAQSRHQNFLYCRFFIYRSFFNCFFYKRIVLIITLNHNHSPVNLII